MLFLFLSIFFLAFLCPPNMLLFILNVKMANLKKISLYPSVFYFEQLHLGEILNNTLFKKKLKLYIKNTCTQYQRKEELQKDLEHYVIW